MTTRYAQDLAVPLPVILSDGAAQYVYGHERLFGAQGGQATWYVPDALGSVRLTLDGAGVPLGSASYDPWGTPVTAAIAPFGFTGELQQGNEVYLRARWYDSAQGVFGSRDPFAGDPEQPYSLHYYQYAYANPVRWTDPSGKCPTPPAVMKRAICMALFIQPAEIAVKFTPFTLHGDGRSFQPNSDPHKSRGYIWLDLDKKVFEAHMNPTGINYFPMLVSIAGCGPSFWVKPMHFTPPSSVNKWDVRWLPNDAVQIRYDLVLSGVLERIAPHINGTITFQQTKTGGYFASGERDGFPWAEAYYYDGSGTTQTIFQRSAVRGNPEDLNALEGAYPYGSEFKMIYDFRRDYLADPHPQRDVFPGTGGNRSGLR